MSGRPDFDLMSEDEVRSWFDAREEESRRQFAGRPRPRISRAKALDEPQWESRGWAFKVTPMLPVRMDLSAPGPLPTRGVGEATMVGLRRAADGGLVVLVRLDECDWALRRADGEAWGDNVTAPWVTVPTLDVECRAWPSRSDESAPLELEGDPVAVSVRTTRLEDVHG